MFHWGIYSFGFNYLYYYYIYNYQPATSALLTDDSEVEGGALLHLQLVGGCAADGTNQIWPLNTTDSQRTRHAILQQT